MLLVFLLLAAIGFICSWLSHNANPQNPSSILITAFLTCITFAVSRSV